MSRFRMRNIKALFICNIEKMNFFKIRSKCITFVGIDHIWRPGNSGIKVSGKGAKQIRCEIRELK